MAWESNSRHFGCYLAITPQQTSFIYFLVFFFLNVKQCYLCLMQKQLRNIFFAKKKTIFTRISMWKFLLIKHLYKLMKYFVRNCYRWVMKMLFNMALNQYNVDKLISLICYFNSSKNHAITSEKTTPHFLERTVTFVDFFCDCKAACWLNTI